MMQLLVKAGADPKIKTATNASTLMAATGLNHGIGENPVTEAEASVTTLPRPARSGNLQINEAIAEAICHAAEELNLKVVAVFTESGSSAGLVSKYRPRAPIVAFSPVQETRRRLALYWGVLPRSLGRVHDIDTLAKAAEQRLLEEKLVKRGDIIGVVAGTPIGTTGSTNLMRLLRIGG